MGSRSGGGGGGREGEATDWRAEGTEDMAMFASMDTLIGRFAPYVNKLEKMQQFNEK